MGATTITITTIMKWQGVANGHFLTRSIFDPYQLRSEFLEVAGTLLHVLLRSPQGDNVLALTRFREGNLQYKNLS